MFVCGIKPFPLLREYLVMEVSVVPMPSYYFSFFLCFGPKINVSYNGKKIYEPTYVVCSYIYDNHV